jgi:hypothetical protein
MLLSDSNPSLAVFAYGGAEGNWTRGDEPLGTERIRNGPAAVSLRPNRIDVFVQGTDNRLYTKRWNGLTWTNYEQLGTEQFAGTPAAVSQGPNRIKVFVRGTDGRLYTKSGDGDNWASNYEQLGTEQIVGTPAAVSWGEFHIEVFVQGDDGRLYRKQWDGWTWASYYEPLGQEKIQGVRAAVSQGPGRTDVFVQGIDGRFYKKSRNGDNWASYYEPLGQDRFDYTSAVVSWGSNRIDVFFQDVYDQRLHMKSWDGTRLMLANDCGPHNPGCTWNSHPAQLTGVDIDQLLGVCDHNGSGCGFSDMEPQKIIVYGQGTCGSFGIKWGDGDEEEIRGWDFDKNTFFGEHVYQNPSGPKGWPGRKIIHVFSMDSCRGEKKWQVNVLTKAGVDSNGIQLYSGIGLIGLGIGIAGSHFQSPPCAIPVPTNQLPLPLHRPMRKGATVTLSQPPVKGMINFGCWFGGCTNDADGNSGATTQSYPFPSMRRHSLVLRIRQDGPGGGVQVVQGGTSTTFVVQQNGPLEFCLNDSDFSDNKGAWGIGVSVDETKVP